jgi:hypothetical protein
MNLNQYLLAHPEKTEHLFVNIFGKYMMRYYDQDKNYAIRYSRQLETSYNDPHRKIIAIAESNVRLLLSMDIPILAIAYHELAHSLYTKQTTRNKIIDLVYYSRHSGSHSLEEVRTIWNVLEDEYIERRMVKEFDFLKEILEPLRTCVEPDDKLMGWRKGLRGKDGIDQRVIQLAERFAEKRLSADKSADIIRDILALYANDNQMPQMEMNSYKKQEEPKQGDGDPKDNEEEKNKGEDNEEEKNKGEDNKDGENKDNENEDEEGGVGNKEEKVQSEVGKRIERLENERKKIEELEGDENIKKLLLNATDESINQQRRLRYNEAVKVVKGPRSYRHATQRITEIYNGKHEIRGMQALAQSKSHSMQITHRINVPLLVEKEASRKAPSVFYGKGKDVSFTKKVVIFEDVSGSTHNFTREFSEIARAISNAFEETEWWAYGSKLYLRHPRDLPYYSYYEANGVGITYATNSQHLLSVMEHYKNEDNTYVIITDGYVGRLLSDPLYQKFKDKIVFIGIITRDMEKASKHTVKYFQAKRELLDKGVERRKAIEIAEVKCVREVIALVKERTCM